MCEQCFEQVLIRVEQQSEQVLIRFEHHLDPLLIQVCEHCVNVYSATLNDIDVHHILIENFPRTRRTASQGCGPNVLQICNLQLLR